MQAETETTNPVAEYFEGLHKSKVTEVGDYHIRITDIPYSGGSHMLPGGFGALDTLAEHWPEHEIKYVDNGQTRMGGREKKDVIIAQFGFDN